MARAATAQEPAIRRGAEADSAAREMVARFERAKGRRQQMSSLIDECYEFTLPLRQRINMAGQEGPPQVDRLFDGTAVSAVQGLASQTLDDVWPADQTPFELKAGGNLDPDEAELWGKVLADIGTETISLTNNSNFRSAAHEAMLDYCIATGILVVEQGDALRPLNFRAIPLTVGVLDLGPYGEPDALFLARKVRASHIKVLWPKATLPQDLAERAAREPEWEVPLIEGSYRDWSRRDDEVWVQHVVWGEGTGAVTLFEERSEGIGSCPFMAFSFSRVAGEVMGRGPVMQALPDIRTANKLTELVLERADLELSGIWQYDDDGVLNPDTAILEPGALIPRSPQSRGLENITPSGSALTADRLMDQLRASIREALYVNDLGDITKTPKSATEIAQRTADRARRLAGPYGRLLTELLLPLVARVWWLLRRMQGRGNLPPIDGDKIKVRALSPLVWAQAQGEVLRAVQYLQTVQGLLGPQAVMLTTDTDKLVRFLADKSGFSPTLLRSKAEQEGLMKQAMALAQSAGMVPGGAAPGAPAA